MYLAHHDGKNIGQAMNSMSAQGKIPKVTIQFPLNPELEPVICSCIFAATDWLKANGFYTGRVGLDKPMYLIY